MVELKVSNDLGFNRWIILGAIDIKQSVSLPEKGERKFMMWWCKESFIL